MKIETIITPLRLSAMAVSLTLLGAPAIAQVADQSGTNAAAMTVEGVGPVAALEAAMMLAEYGLAQQDPRILIGAAHALQMIGEQNAGAPESSGSAVIEGAPALATDSAVIDKPETMPETAPSDRVADLLRSARFLARGDEMLLAQISEVEASATRGSTAGPGKYPAIQVDARTYHDLKERFSGGEVAEVAIVGDGDSDVDLHVLDQNGNVICESESKNDREYCKWIPAWTGTFTIRLRNLGRVWNAVTVITN